MRLYPEQTPDQEFQTLRTVHIFLDKNTGQLRKKNGVPTSDSDGDIM